ncbi:hypothetical protein PAMP_023337 [Pampus punctatissimus]
MDVNFAEREEEDNVTEAEQTEENRDIKTRRAHRDVAEGPHMESIRLRRENPS